MTTTWFTLWRFVWKSTTVNDITSIWAVKVNRSHANQSCEDPVLLSVTSLNFLDMYQRFSVMFCLHLQDKNAKSQKVILQKDTQIYIHMIPGLQDICCWNEGTLFATYQNYVTLIGHNHCMIDIVPPPNHSSSQLNWVHLCFVHRASWYNRVKKNQLDAQLTLSIFRQPLHVSGISRPIIRRYKRMYTTIGTYEYYSF